MLKQNYLVGSKHIDTFNASNESSRTPLQNLINKELRIFVDEAKLKLDYIGNESIKKCSEAAVTKLRQLEKDCGGVGDGTDWYETGVVTFFASADNVRAKMLDPAKNHQTNLSAYASLSHSPYHNAQG